MPRVQRMLMGLMLGATVTFPLHAARASLTTVDLGTAGNFAVLAGSGITVGGAVNTTTINGNIGTYPTPSITGLGNVVLNGANQTANSSLMLIAKNDLTTAFTAASGQTPVTALAGSDNQLGGQTLVSGVYSFGGASTANLIGNLTLNGQGNANSVWVFIASSTLVTASSSSVTLINGADGCNIFWVVDSSATLKSGSVFNGNIMALTSIDLGTGADILDGSALAENGAVTLDGNNTITREACNSVGAVPEPTTLVTGALLLLPLGATALRKLRQSRGNAV